MKRVYTYVVADLLHVGHVRYLRRARALGDRLIVGVLTTEACMEKKTRPVINHTQRMITISALQCVDQAVKQDTYSPRENIGRYRIDVLVESENHENPHELDDIVKVVVLPYTKGISGSKLKERIINAAKEGKRN